MSMSKIDYERIAETIRPLVGAGEAVRDESIDRSYWDGYLFGLTDVVLAVSQRLAISNPRFDRDRFIRACGLEPIANGIKAMEAKGTNLDFIEEPYRMSTGEDVD